MKFCWFLVIIQFVTNGISTFPREPYLNLEVESEKKYEDLEILDISPRSAVIDSSVELQISIAETSNLNSTNVWCCVQSSDNETLILSANIINNQIICSKFTPDVPGFIQVTVNCYNIKSGTATVKILEKPLKAEKAEYCPDFLLFVIYFNQNIELGSDCASVFSPKTAENFGTGFTCEVTGNRLSVVLGLNFKKTDCLEIVAGNPIYRSGCKDFTTSSAALPMSLHVFEKKVLGPNLSLNSDCDSDPKHKHMSIMTVPLETQHPDDYSKTFKPKTIGKSHRENLMVWRIIRHLQTRLSSSQIDVHINSTDVHPSLEHLVSLESFIENERHFNVTTESVVSVVVTSPPAPSVIFAEAKVTFCYDNITLFQYKWSVNDEVLQEDGKVLEVKDLFPGKYVITCTIVEYNTSKVLGQGWTTAEITETFNNDIIYPSEVEVGREGNISLYTTSWYRGTTSWTCRTESDGLCYTTNGELINNLVDLNTSVLFISSGLLPVGSYFWSIGRGQEATVAKVTVKTTNFPSVSWDNSITINSSQVILINGVVQGLEMGCKVWYTSVRQKGFDYLDLQELKMSQETEISTELSEDIDIPLILSPEAVESKALKSGSSYMFRLQALCPASGHFSQIKIPIFVNDPPSLSCLSVEPLEGSAMITEFTISGGEANDTMEDHPLLFEWSIVYPCGNEIQLEEGVFSKHFNTFLPPGDIVVKLKVCDIKEACSVIQSSIVSVIQPTQIPSENIEKVFRKIQFSMASGEIDKAFTLAEIILRSIALTPEAQIREELSDILVVGLSTKMFELKRKPKVDLKHRQTYFELVDKGFRLAKFLPKESDVFSVLTDIRDLILRNSSSKRIKRNSGFNMNKIKSIFKLHSSVIEKNDSLENRMELLKDVRKYMLEVCSDSLRNSFLMVSPIVNITIMKVDLAEEGNRSVEYHFNDSLALQITGESFQRKTCIGVAQFLKDFLGNTNESRLTPVYDVQVVSDGKFVKSLKNHSTFLTLTFPLFNTPEEGVDCLTWSKSRGWTSKCEFKGTKKGIVCVCKEFGYFSTFLRFPKIKGSLIDKNRQKITYWDSCVVFTLNGDYERVVGKNQKSFVDGLKRQITQQLKVPSKTIQQLTVKPGSILVTVFFIDINETKAETVVKELVTRIYTRDLQLTGRDNVRLEVDTNAMEILISPGTKFNALGIRLATYILLSMSVFLVFAIGLLIILKKNKPQCVILREISVSKKPMYRRFYDEYSLNGHSVGLVTCGVKLYTDLNK